MSGKVVDFDKLKDYPQNSYAFLWMVLCVVVVLVHLTAAVLVSKSTDLRVSAASSSVPYTCTFSPGSVNIGESFTVTSSPGGAFGLVQIQGAWDLKIYNLNVNLPQSGSVTARIPMVDTAGLYAVRVGSLGATCKTLAGADLAIQNVLSSPKPPLITCSQVDFDHDLKISILDLTLMSKAFGSKVGDVKYNKVYDLDNDGAITTLDLAIVSKHFGEKCPV